MILSGYVRGLLKLSDASFNTIAPLVKEVQLVSSAINLIQD
jgi:hypothetical protein